MTTPENDCPTCDGSGVVTECANDGPTGCSHVFDREYPVPGLRSDAGRGMTELPRTAAALKVKAELAGWTVTVTRSDEHDSVALRLTRGRQRAAAVWKANSFVGAYVLGRLVEGPRAWPLPHRLGAREIATLVGET